MELFSAESETFEVHNGEVLVNRLEVSVHRHFAVVDVSLVEEAHLFVVLVETSLSNHLNLLVVEVLTCRLADSGDDFACLSTLLLCYLTFGDV